MRTTAFNAAMLLDRLAKAAPPCLYGLGVALLAAKLLSLSEPLPAWALTFAALGATVLWAAAPLLRNGGWYSPDYARAWLDLHNHAGGAILSGEDPGKARLAVRPGVSPGFMASQLVLPAVFLLAAVLVPAPARTPAVSGASVERAAARLEREMAEAEERGALAAPDAEELRRQVQRLQEMAANNPEAAAEAMDRLAATMDAVQARRLERLAEAVNKASDALEGVNAAAEGDADAALALDENAGELFGALDRLAESEGGLDNLPPELAQALRDAISESGAGSLREMANAASAGQGMSKESLERILETLSGTGNSLSGTYQEMAREGGGRPMPSLSSLNEALNRAEQLQGAGEGVPGAMMAGGQGSGAGAGEGETGQGGPGSGGVSRGPGEAPLVFGRESDQAGARFELAPLPLGEGSLPDQMLQRERARPPETMPPEEFRPVWRTAVDAPERVHAGDAGAVLGPERARAAERYFMKLGETR